jgi:hypothetical protein
MISRQIKGKFIQLDSCSSVNSHNSGIDKAESECKRATKCKTIILAQESHHSSGLERTS